MRYLVHFNFGIKDAFGESIEVLSENDMMVLNDFVGNKVFLGEIAGKHSKIQGPLEESDFKIISTNENEIEVFEKLLGSSFGAFDMIGTIHDTISEQGN